MDRKILHVEDDWSNRQLVEEALRPEGYVVKSVGTVRDAVASLAREVFDLVLLDVMLPDGDGFSLCREIRKKTSIPIVMMTARSELDDVVAGLDVGADDYIVKPFHVRTLIARVRAQLRRSTELNLPASERPIVIGELTIDPGVRDAIVGGSPARLTPKEFELLYYLGKQRGRAASKDTVTYQIWGDEEDRSEKILAVYIRHLREKIEPNPETPRYLHTIRGFGYRLADEP
jgi:two-component system alkaline phosphatase synthesis response regulator PhoP